MAGYYDVPIELIRVIHCMCEPEGYGEFRIADARLADHDRFVDYKQSCLTIVTKEATETTYKSSYTTFRGNRHGDCRQWHDNGCICSYKFYIHGKIHGALSRWYDNEQLRSYAFFIHGKLEGEHRSWYRNESPGQVPHPLARSFYKDGLIHGEHKKWHSNGQLHFHAFHMHGKSHGEFKQWYDNGQLYIYVQIKHGINHGDYKRWTIDGTLVSHRIFSDGVKISP